MTGLRVLGQPFEGGKIGAHAVLEWAIFNTAGWVTVVGLSKVLGEPADAADKVGTVLDYCQLLQLI